jgi:hypothetical protein
MTDRPHQDRLDRHPDEGRFDATGLRALIDGAAVGVVTPPLTVLRQRRSARRRRAGLAVSAAIIAVAGGLAVREVGPTDGTDRGATARAPAVLPSVEQPSVLPGDLAAVTSAGPTPSRTALTSRQLFTSSLADCPETRTAPRSLEQGAFVFDGTVTAIGDRLVTFSVTEWFRGGPAPTVMVPFPKPDGSSWYGMHGLERDRYEIGTRLLVLGETRAHEPFDQGWVSTLCGPTSYYSPQLATVWRTYFSRSTTTPGGNRD